MVDGGLNFSSYKNNKVDTFYQKARSVSNKNEAENYYKQIQAEMFEDPPGIFLFWRNEYYLVNSRFHDVYNKPLAFYPSIPHWWVPKEEQKYKEPPV